MPPTTTPPFTHTHTPPGPGCDCGIRLTLNLGELLNYIRWGETPVPWSRRADHLLRQLAGDRGGPVDSGFAYGARKRGADYARNRAAWGVLDVPDVVGLATGYGRRRRSRTDLPTTWLCERATVGGRLGTV